METPNKNIDFFDFVKTSYEHKLVEIDPKNPLFWNRFKMKQEIDKWKDDISNAFWNQYEKDWGCNMYDNMLSLNIIDEYYNILLDDYDEKFSEVVGEILKKMYHETNNQ